MFLAYFLVIAKNWKQCTISKDGGGGGHSYYHSFLMVMQIIIIPIYFGKSNKNCNYLKDALCIK